MKINRKINSKPLCALLYKMNELIITIVVLSLVSALSLGPLSRSAHSITYETEAALTDAQHRIEESGLKYDEIMKKIEETNLAIAQNEEKIKEIEADLPGQREKSSSALKALYVMQSNSSSLLDLVLHSDSFAGFLESVHYLNMVTSSTHDEIDRLQTMHQELDDVKNQLAENKEALEIESESAHNSLLQAQADREAAQEQARLQAQAEAAEAARIAQEALEAEQEKEALENQEGHGDIAQQPNFDIGWSVDKATFVNEWTARIDAYLAGSPTAGCGIHYAQAAWDFGVDPRWSPAISNTESSKGAALFRPFNAWGWGSFSYGSWEEAIYAHVGGLSRGYGYTISIEGAKKYCPPTYEHWYTVTLAQMNMI